MKKYIRCPICTTVQPYEVDFCVYCATVFDKSVLQPIERKESMVFETVKGNLEQLGYRVSVFETAAEAAEYLDREIDGVSVAMGGSMTLEALGIYEKLTAHNEVIWHQKQGREALSAAVGTDVYLSSVNGIAQTGEIINIDGNCNRVASTLYGHKRVYLVAGVNKLAEDYDKALWRARNIAAPLNAKRLGRKTPCAVKGDRCYNCKSPERICRALTVLWTKPSSCEYEVVLINEELGY